MAKDSNHILHLYTLHFPYGAGETFIANELPYLAAAFDKVRIFPKSKGDSKQFDIPDNVEIHSLEVADSGSNTKELMGLMLKNVTNRSFLKALRRERSRLAQIQRRADALEKVINMHENVIHYSYWFEEWSTVLGILAKRKRIKGHVTRAHNFDLYDYRNSLGYHPDRPIQTHGLRSIFPVSQGGADYLRKRISNVPIRTHYLGTLDMGYGPDPVPDCLRIVSIGRTVEVKRIHEIAKVLQGVELPVRWTHMGSGNQENLLLQEADKLPGHIELDYKGEVTHAQVIENLKSSPFDLLVSLSSSEGVPVSMMEALSFGIPVVSTEVGGVAEIVSDKTGVLVDSEIDHKDIAQLLNDWKHSGLSSKEYRNQVKREWNKRFSAQNNYPQFIEELKNLFKN